MKKWYSPNSSDGQGIIACESTGATIAVSYDKSDAPLIASAPSLLHAAKEFIAELDSSGDFANWERVKQQLKDAVQEAEPNGEPS